MLKRCVFKSHRKAAFESVCLIDYSQCLVRRLKKRVDRAEFWFEGQRRTWPPMTVVDDAVGSIFIMFVFVFFVNSFCEISDLTVFIFSETNSTSCSVQNVSAPKITNDLTLPSGPGFFGTLCNTSVLRAVLLSSQCRRCKLIRAVGRLSSVWHNCMMLQRNNRCVRHYPRESEGLCFYRRWFVCLSVCLFVTTTTK